MIRFITSRTLTLSRGVPMEKKTTLIVSIVIVAAIIAVAIGLSLYWSPDDDDSVKYVVVSPTQIVSANITLLKRRLRIANIYPTDVRVLSVCDILFFPFKNYLKPYKKHAIFMQRQLCPDNQVLMYFDLNQARKV